MIVLETDRLALRKLTLEDAPFLLRLLNTPLFIKYIGDRGVKNLDDACAYLTKAPMRSYDVFGFGMYGVELKTTGDLIGLSGLVNREGLDYIDLGFAFLPEYGGNGYATESAQGVLEYARDELKVPKLVGITSPENAASIRVLEKIGMVYEGVVPLPREGDPVKLFGIAFEQNLIES
jgi:ribosomal-protein-alanine N-acetyltransferase